jgi:hypothetical protein
MNNHNETTLINILNTMYNDNLRQIHNLQDSNIQIRNLMVDILSTRRPMNRNVRNIGRYNSLDTIPVRTTTTRTYTPDNSLLNTVYLARQSAREARANAEFFRRQNNPQDNINNLYLQHFFEPVEVYPTPTQIENATRVVLYRDIVTPNNQSCPISLEPFNDNDTVSVIRYCGHIFHTEELHEWFRSNCRCPVCRYDIRNYSRNSENSIQLTEPTVENQQGAMESPEMPPSEESEPLTRGIARPNNQMNINDSSGNLLNSLTDILLNSLLNSYSETQPATSSPILLDIIFDTSYNPINNPLTNTHNTQTRYYSVPYPRRNA